MKAPDFFAEKKINWLHNEKRKVKLCKSGISLGCMSKHWFSKKMLIHTPPPLPLQKKNDCCIDRVKKFNSRSSAIRKVYQVPFWKKKHAEFLVNQWLGRKSKSFDNFIYVYKKYKYQ